MTRFRVWLAFALLSLIWGSSYLFIRLGLRQLSPLSLVALRVSIGFFGLALVVLALRQDVRLPRRLLLATVVVATLNTTVPFLLISWGELTVPSGLASVLNSTVPIFSVVIAAVALRDEPITASRSAGVALGFIGVLILASRDLGHNGIEWNHLAGQAAIVLSSLFYALSAVFTRRTLRGTPSLVVAFYTLAGASLETDILSLIFSRPPLTSMHPLTLFSMVWLGLLGSGLAYILYFFIIENWGASRATLVTYMLPLVGLTLGAIVLGEVIDWRILLGSVLVVGGVVLASLIRRPTPARTRAAANQPTPVTSE